MFLENSLMIRQCLATNFHLLEFLRKIFELVVFARYLCFMLFHCFFMQLRQFLISKFEKIIIFKFYLQLAWNSALLIL